MTHDSCFKHHRVLKGDEMKSKREKALELLLDWAIQCDFGYDNIPEEYEKYKDEIKDMDYTEGLIYIAEREIEDQDHSGCDDDSCPIVFD